MAARKGQTKAGERMITHVTQPDTTPLVDDLEGRLTAARAGYLDNLSAGAVALAASVGTLVNSGGGVATLGGILGDVANSSIAARFGILQNHLGPSYNSSRYLAVTADFTNATWNDFVTTPKHEVFNVTGLVRLRMWITCTGNVDSAVHGATICFGHDANTAAFIAATDETELDSGDLWYSATPTLGCDTFGNAVMDYVSNGLDVGYQIAGEALNAGSLVFHCVWEPLNATGNVTAGAGGTL